ncbi:MAG: AMP-binding protein [Candidatus Eremiobacteraeota bacterium]|nr:AMP-binding protein [Candidatus Eremiobacteraeota bacterium]
MPELLPADLNSPQWLNAAAELLDRRVRRDGNRRCIVAPSGETWSYAQLLDAANRIAAVLVEDMGLTPGNRVLLRAPNTPMLAACWFAVLKAGGIAVTTMPLYRSAELGVMLQKARISHALCDARLRDELDRASAGTPQIDVLHFHDDGSAPRPLELRMASKSGHFENVKTAAEDVALIAFTSGTTGTPKAAMHYHRDIMAICDTYCARVLQPREDDLFCGSPPLGFTFGLGGLLVFPLYAGAATLLLEKAGPAELLAAVAEFGVTTIFTAPLAYRAMAANCANFDFKSLRACVSAGETLPKPIWEDWHAKTGLKILDGIGSTEMLHIFIGSPEADVRAGSTGRAVPGYAAEIHDDNGRRVEPGVVGRLAVKGPTGCKYLDDPRQTSYVQNGWNYPGDAYRMDEDGYCWYVARTDDMIVSAGYNISGPEVEQALIAHAEVREVAVVGKRDPQRATNYVKAFVVLADGCAASAEKGEELREFCKAQIAPFKAPREVEFVAALPRTETGKLQRYKLRD